MITRYEVSFLLIDIADDELPLIYSSYRMWIFDNVDQ